MYVHGMSTRDIEATFADVLSGTGVSKSVVSRVTRCLSEDFESFRKRDLSNEELDELLRFDAVGVVVDLVDEDAVQVAGAPAAPDELRGDRALGTLPAVQPRQR